MNLKNLTLFYCMRKVQSVWALEYHAGLSALPPRLTSTLILESPQGAPGCLQCLIFRGRNILCLLLLADAFSLVLSCQARVWFLYSGMER